MNKNMIRKNAHGFILVDVIIGMIILVVALTAIGGLYIQTSRVSLFADNQTVANNWAQQRLEGLKSADRSWRASLTLPVTDAAMNSTPPRPGFVMETTAVVRNNTIAALPTRLPTAPVNTAFTVPDGVLLSAVNNRLIHMTVTVRWNENGNAQAISLETLIDN